MDTSLPLVGALVGLVFGIVAGLIMGVLILFGWRRHVRSLDRRNA